MRAHRAFPSELSQWSSDLESAVLRTIESGKMTKDLAVCIFGSSVKQDQYLLTAPFMDAVRAELDRIRAPGAGRSKL